MPLNVLHHCSIRTLKLKKTRDFFVKVLGMKDGKRPNFKFPGHWLYVGKEPVVHLIGVDPKTLKKRKDTKACQGSGAVDHIAFNISEPRKLRRRIKRHSLEFVERKVPGSGLYQIFLHDPNGIKVELNYWA